MNEYIAVQFTGKVIEPGYAEVRIGNTEQKGYISIHELNHARYEYKMDPSEPIYFVYKLMEKSQRKAKIIGEILGEPLLTVKIEMV